jgi:hypothetical protein
MKTRKTRKKGKMQTKPENIRNALIDAQSSEEEVPNERHQEDEESDQLDEFDRIIRRRPVQRQQVRRQQRRRRVGTMELVRNSHIAAYQKFMSKNIPKLLRALGVSSSDSN